MQMTSSEPPSKTPSSKAHRHPAARALDAKAGGGSAAMKKREIDNLDNVSVSQKEEKVRSIFKLSFLHDCLLAFSIQSNNSSFPNA